MSDDDVTVEPEDDGAEEKADAKLKKLRDELKETQKERDDYLAGWQRAKADYVNLSRRIREDDQAQTRNGAAKIARGVIAVMDSLEAARKNSTVDEKTLSALALIERQLEEVLKGFGVVVFTPEQGAMFDPLVHEPIQTVATEEENEDNTISETLQSGYAIDGVPIRPARVKVRHYNPS